MARVVRFPIDEGEVLDDEFLYQLQRGGEHLARGESEAARIALRRAAEMRPDEPKMLGLLGQAAYRLGEYEEAAEAYGRLAKQSPAEPRAQVNLGLALLKGGHAAEAITHLERALDLSPEHRRAMGYLGLAWLERGNVARARSWFERGGREQMVRRCDVLLRAEKRRVPGAAPAVDKQARAAEKAPRPSESAPRLVEKPPRVVESARPAAKAVSPDAAPALDGWTVGTKPMGERRWDGLVDRELQDVLRMLDEYSVVDSVGPANGPAIVRDVAPALVLEQAVTGVEPEAELSETLERSVAEEGGSSLATGLLGTPAGTFDTGRVLQVSVEGEVLVRRRGLVAVLGQVELAAEAKRARGRPSEEPFGSGASALQRARGHGVLVYAADGRRYTALDVGGAGLQLREAAVFAFDGGLAFENARLAAPEGPEVELVRLSGDGAVLVATAGELATIDVQPDRPLRVAVGSLVAWSGTLTPQLAALLGSRGAADAVELAGEGRVFLDPGAPLA